MEISTSEAYNTKGILDYLRELTGLAPAREQALSSGNFITNSFLTHYKALCEEKKIAFRCQTLFNEGQIGNKAHLGIIKVVSERIILEE